MSSMRFTTTLKVFAIAIVVFIASYTLWLPEVGMFLLTDDISSATDPDAIDAAVVLMGGIASRPRHAASLFGRLHLPRIILATPVDNDFMTLKLIDDEAQLTKNLLMRYGVPAEKIEIIGGKRVSSTWEEAQAIKEYITTSSPNIRNLLVISSWFHTSRARWVFRKVFQGTNIKILMSAAPSNYSAPATWWQTEEGQLVIALEYLKWGRYLWNFGI